MRHHKKKKVSGGGHAFQKALKRNLMYSFFTHDRILTTQAKAKLIKPLIEKVITTAKTDSLTSRRKLIKLLGSNTLATKIIKDIAPRYRERHGGYTRIIKRGPRRGDGAPVVYLAFV